MAEKNTITEDRIKKIAVDFTLSTLGVQCCHYLCYAISYPLHIHLTNIGISNSLKAGCINNQGHYWISLNYPYKLIIDATARQFDPIADYVHFGEELVKEGPNDFNGAFDAWFLRLITYNRITEESMKPEERERMRSTESYIKTGVKAALILIKDNELEKIKDAELKNTNQVYIKAICQVSGNFYRQHPEKLAGIYDAEKVFQYCSKNIS